MHESIGGTTQFESPWSLVPMLNKQSWAASTTRSQKRFFVSRPRIATEKETDSVLL